MVFTQPYSQAHCVINLSSVGGKLSVRVKKKLIFDSACNMLARTLICGAQLSLATSSASEGACNVADATDVRWLLQIGGQEVAAKRVLLLASLAASQHLRLHHGLAQLAFVTAE